MLVEYITLGITVLILCAIIAYGIYSFILKQMEKVKVKREIRLKELKDRKRELEASLKSHSGIVTQITDTNIKATFEAIIKQAEEEIKVIDSEIQKLETPVFQEVIQK